MSDSPPDPKSVKYEATPRDQARTYQTGGAQHITEYHYHGTPPGPPKPSMSLSKRVLLAAGLAVVLGGGGAALWVLAPWQSTPGDQGAAAAKVSSSPSPSASPSVSPQPTAEAKDSAAPPADRSEPAPKSSASGVAAPPAEAPSSSAPSPKEEQTEDCRGRTAVAGVTVDVCVRQEGEDVYMIYELTGTETPRLVDVYMWLEDSATKRVVDYVAATDKPYGYYKMRADLTPRRREHVVEVPLRHGTSYEVCVGVVPAGAATPDFRSPNVSGVMRGFVY
ncbi:hypothetical protein BSZ07_23105 [Streptomyces sp. M1013]|jgi:hypothetical protein|uniref:hypothetical protein n=1 Tax=Streptomyces sp. M1013 TaxID=549798 RepID=UPI00097AFD81|nr:hypothetical protein [Streptomyces sp. M1013]OMI87142.1 hypothetical protein BSZ07_23105 [Streptomyces sp. M1013]